MDSISINPVERNEEVSIKVLEVADVPAYVQMHRRSWLDTYPNDDLGLSRDKLEEILNKKSLTKRIDELTARVEKGLFKDTKVLYAGKELIGVTDVCMSELDDKMYGQIRMIYLDPDYIGKGYGAKLMKNALKQLKEMGANSFFVQVASYNNRAIEFYKKFGFTDEVEIEPFQISEFALPQLRMFFKESSA